MPRRPLVSSATVWIDGDQPSVDLSVKGAWFFIPFNRNITYSRPIADIAIYEERGDDPPLTVPAWSWWLQFDDAEAELYCGNRGVLGYSLEYTDSRNGVIMSIPLTFAEGPRLAAAIEKMLRRVSRDANGRVVDMGPRILSVARRVPRFHVNTWQYNHPRLEGDAQPRMRRGGLEPVHAAPL
jgi:hypothetical protein